MRSEGSPLEAVSGQSQGLFVSFINQNPISWQSKSAKKSSRNLENQKFHSRLASYLNPILILHFVLPCLADLASGYRSGVKSEVEFRSKDTVKVGRPMVTNTDMWVPASESHKLRPMFMSRNLRASGLLSGLKPTPGAKNSFRQC